MKLLITTQVVDKNDSQLGFFHRWIEELATHYSHVTVICMRKGHHSLPTNVNVLSLGKEKGTSRLTRTLRFYRYIISRKNTYDDVFVHMNPEYVVLGGLLWRLWGKKVILWYTHKSVNLKLRIATLFANAITTASPESFRLKSKKVHVLGHGIDTEFFSPDPRVVRGEHVLSVGRLSKSKRHDLAIKAAVSANKELRIAGEGPEKESLQSLAHNLGARVTFLGGLTQAQLRDEYRKAAYLIHTSETGSLDKVVLEALASGLPIHTNNQALKYLESKNAEYVRQGHSITGCVRKICDLFLSLH